MSKKYIEEIAGYRIDISKGYFDELVDKIILNQTIVPETLGYLLGTAIPVKVPSQCGICKRKVLRGTEYKSDINSDTDFNIRTRFPCHAGCMEKEKQKRGCTCIWDRSMGKCVRIDKGICKIHG